MNAIFQCLAKGASSLRSSPKYLVMKEGRNLQGQVLALRKLPYNAEWKVVYLVQARHVVKVELPQFADNKQQGAHEFLMTILPVLQLPRYQGSVSSVLQCKTCRYQSIKKEVLSCIEVPVPERGAASLENCLDRWWAADKVRDWKCTSCSQHGSGVKKLVLEAVLELLIIQLKGFGKVESSVEKIYKQVKFPLEKTVIGSKKCEMKGVTYNSDHYRAAVKFKESLWNCNNAVVKIMEERNVVSEAAYVLFYKQMWGYLKTTMSDRTFG